MSLVTTRLASLLFFSALAIAEIVYPTCNDTASWKWAFNSIGQSPCEVLAYMASTCNGGQYTLFTLQPTWMYPPPKGQNDNLCQCSTVGYSLFSACAGCQEEGWLSWPEWVTYCTKTMPPSTFPNLVPYQIRVPQWALIDVRSDVYWNNTRAYFVGDSPETGPGALINQSSSASPTNYPTNSPTSSPTSLPSKGGSNTGAIAGGVIGGVVASIAIATIFYLRGRRSRITSTGDGATQPMRSQVASAEDGATRPMSDVGMIAPSPRSPPPTYDPYDPTMFPEYQGGQPSLDIPSASQGPLSLHVTSGGTLGDRQTRAKGYHGLPMPGN